MKKSFKKVIGAGLVLTMAMATLVGCNQKDSNTYLIGAIGPLTGEAAAYGISVKQGAQIALDEIKAAGGIQVGDKKLQLEMDFRDDEAAAENAVTQFNALMDKNVDAIMGTVTSGAGLGIIDLTKEEGILMLTPSGSAAGLTKHDNAFRLCFTDPVQGVTMANYAKEQGYTKIAVIFNNSDDYSVGMKEAFVEQVASNGGTIVAEESFAKGDVDFNTQLTKIKGTDAEVIFIPSYYGEAANIATQSSALGMSLPLLGGDGWDNVIANTVDPSVLNGSVFLSPFNSSEEDPTIQAFVKTYEENYKSTPDQFAADGYDAVYIIKLAVEKAGTTDKAAVIAAMTEIELDGLTGHISFNDNGEPNKEAKFVEIVDGKYVVK